MPAPRVRSDTTSCLKVSGLTEVSASYTIAVDCFVTDVDATSAAKSIASSGGTEWAGAYVIEDGSARVFTHDDQAGNWDEAGAGSFVDLTTASLVVTRDGATNVVQVYVDGVNQSDGTGGGHPGIGIDDALLDMVIAGGLEFFRCLWPHRHEDWFRGRHSPGPRCSPSLRSRTSALRL